MSYTSVFRFRHVRGALAVVYCCIIGSALAAEDLPQREQQAIQTAVARVAPSVVKIETVGGLERIGNMLVNTGPTTGLVVSADGYIISSAFNFISRPSSILISLPDGTRTPAKLVATDHQRMLVLLKINVDQPLTVPEAVAESEIQVGQWAIALGRTYDSAGPNISVGIDSGKNRIWGKAIQTDAKISPSNYGGPLVDIRGRVLGVLVPLSPESTDNLAGVEWYDSGIGFAVPLAHINTVLPKLAAGQDLKPGILGVSLDGRDIYSKPPVIVGCRPNSPAYKAGLKAGDRIVEIDGHPVVRQAQLRERINRHYAGETLRVVVLRGEERIERDLELIDHLDPFQRPFLGILPLRDAPAAVGGTPVRFVYPDSPAAQADVQPGDILLSLNGQPTAARDALLAAAAGFEVGDKVKVEFRRGAELRSVELTTVAETAQVPTTLPAAHDSTTPREAPAAQAQQVGRISVKLPEFKNDCLAYVPEAYDPSAAYGLVVWLHPPGGTPEDELLARWREPCEQQRLILLAPRAVDPARWTPTEVDFAAKAIADLRQRYNIDSQRIVLHGHQSGGTLAYMIAFTHRDVVRGVAAVDAPVPGRVPENDPALRLAFFTTTAKKANFAQQIAAGIEQLQKLKYTVTIADEGETARYLNAEEFAELLRWIDSLDKV